MMNHLKPIQKALACTLLSLLGAWTNQVWAQDPPPEVPQNFGINQIQTSENLSSGVLNINLPIENHLVPVSISYNTSGIRIAQQAGEVGQGWTLNAGGYIMRQKRDKADDEEYGFSGENARGNHLEYPGPYIPIGKMAEYVDTRKKGTFGILPLDWGTVHDWDNEPDIYTYSFLGQNGSFTIRSDRTIVKLTPSNLNITVDHLASLDQFRFTIVDELGNKYYFNVAERVKVKPKKQSTEEYYWNKWNLTLMEEYTTNKKVRFSYVKEDRYERTNYLNSRYYKYNTSTLSSIHQQIVSIEYQHSLLSKISCEGTDISFTYGSRTDQSHRKKLESIQYIINGETKASYRFTYDYIGNRLALRNVSKSGLDVLLYQFLYYGDGENEPVLPGHKSTQQDHWGFHNANDSGTLYEILGADRSPSLDHAQANTLKRILHTAGGYDEFEYELNTYMKEGLETEVGGLRIKNVYKGDVSGTRYLIKSYDYTEQVNGQAVSSGKLYAEPVYSKVYALLFNGIGKWVNDHREYPLGPLSDDLGRHICYRQVSTTDLDGGRIESRFHVFEDDILTFGTGLVERFESTWYYNLRVFNGYNWFTEAKPSNNPESGPLGTRNFNGTMVGYPSQVTVFDNNGKILQSESYQYKIYKSSAYTKGISSTTYGDNVASKEDHAFKAFFWGVYTLSTGYAQLDKKTTTAYDPEDAHKSLATITEYSYHADRPLLPIKTATCRSGKKNKARVQETTYLFESNAKANSDNLLTLVETQEAKISDEETGVDLAILSTGTNAYGTNALGKIVLTATKQYSGSATNQFLTSDISHKYHHSTGRLASSENHLTGRSTTSILDDHSQYALATVVDAPYHECAYSSFEGHHTGGWSHPAFGFVNVCEAEYEACATPVNCQDEEGEPLNQECLQDCKDTRDACLNSHYRTNGLFGKYGFDLSEGSIDSPSLAAGKEFRISYWHKDGTISISGLSSNTLINSRTLEGWIYEERNIIKTSTGTFSITGTATIDELKLYPSGAEMTTSTVDPVFGTTSETDVNNQTVFYEYDEAGRLSVVLDKNRDVVTAKQYHIAPFFDVLTTHISPSYDAEDIRVTAVSNEQWSVALDGNPDWVSLSKNAGTFTSDVIISTTVNNTTSTRSATVRFTSASGQERTLTVNQGFYEGSFSVSPRSLSFTKTQETHTVEVLSNTGWTVTTDNISPLYVSETEGSGNGSFDVTLEARYVGQGLITVTFSDGSELTIFINANAPEGDE